MQENLHTQLESDTDTVQVKKMNPLVSIIVITYNSSKYVLETLESAKTQTYQNIELIVSDDFSTDDTVGVCRKWIEANKKQFVSTNLITVSANTGIPANCNRGIKASKGEWIKLIAGDDLLTPNCLVDNIDFIRRTIGAKFIFSDMSYFKSGHGDNIVIKKTKSDNLIFASDSNLQYRHLVLVGNFVYAPTSFCNTKSLVQYGLFDERIPLVEDFPMWLKITKAGEKLFLLDKITILYRQHDASINSSSSKSNKYNLALWKVYKNYIMKDAFRFNFFTGWHLLIIYWIACYNRDKINLRKYALLLSPHFYYNKSFRKKI